MSKSIVRYVAAQGDDRNNVDGKYDINYQRWSKVDVRQNYDQTIKHILQHVVPVLLIGILSFVAANSLSEILYVLLKPHIKLGNLILHRLTNSTSSASINDLYEIPLMLPETYQGLIFVMFFGAFYSVRLYLLKYYYHDVMPNRINYRVGKQKTVNKHGNTTLRKRAKSPARFTQKRAVRG